MARDIHAEEQMYKAIAGWQASGLSQLEYCKVHGIRYHVFHYWYKKYNSRDVASKHQQGFIALQVGEQRAAYAEVCFASGHRVSFHQPVSVDYLKALLG